MVPTTRHAAAPEIYRVEPYVACRFIYGPESDRPGEGSHSCATDTAAWMLIVVRPELEGLRWCWASPAPRGLSICLLYPISCIQHRVVVKASFCN